MNRKGWRSAAPKDGAHVGENYEASRGNDSEGRVSLVLVLLLLLLLLLLLVLLVVLVVVLVVSWLSESSCWSR